MIKSIFLPPLPLPEVSINDFSPTCEQRKGYLELLAQGALTTENFEQVTKEFNQLDKRMGYCLFGTVAMVTFGIFLCLANPVVGIGTALLSVIPIKLKQNYSAKRSEKITNEIFHKESKYIVNIYIWAISHLIWQRIEKIENIVNIFNKTSIMEEEKAKDKLAEIYTEHFNSEEYKKYTEIVQNILTQINSKSSQYVDSSLKFHWEKLEKECMAAIAKRAPLCAKFAISKKDSRFLRKGYMGPGIQLSKDQSDSSYKATVIYPTWIKGYSLDKDRNIIYPQWWTKREYT